MLTQKGKMKVFNADRNITGSRSGLEVKSDQIEAVMAEHRMDAHVHGGMVTPRLIRFFVRVASDVKMKNVTPISGEIASALGADGVRIYRQRETIIIEMVRRRTEMVRLLPLLTRLPEVQPFTAVLGVDEAGSSLLLRLPALDVGYIPIIGAAGSGKTTLIRTILASLALLNPPKSLRMLFLAPHRRSFAGLDRFPHALGETIENPVVAARIINETVTLMERRIHEGINHPLLVIAVDELDDMIKWGNRLMEAAFLKLIQRGRMAGIHVVGCAQSPIAGLIDNEATAKRSVRLVGAVAGKNEARYATGITDSGAEKLTGAGDFLLVTMGEAVRFQAAMLNDNDPEINAKLLGAKPALPTFASPDKALISHLQPKGG